MSSSISLNFDNALSLVEQMRYAVRHHPRPLSPTVSGASLEGQVDPESDQSHWYRCLGLGLMFHGFTKTPNHFYQRHALPPQSTLCLFEQEL